MKVKDLIEDKWIEYGKPFSDFRLEFQGSRRVGMLVKCKGKVYLIGDVNELGGECDCCQLLADSNIIEEYSKLVNLDGLSSSN